MSDRHETGSKTPYTEDLIRRGDALAAIKQLRGDANIVDCWSAVAEVQKVEYIPDPELKTCYGNKRHDIVDMKVCTICKSRFIRRE